MNDMDLSEIKSRLRDITIKYELFNIEYERASSELKEKLKSELASLE